MKPKTQLERYERLLRRLRADNRLFETDDDHKIHRILLKVKARVIALRPPRYETSRYAEVMWM